MQKWVASSRMLEMDEPAERLWAECAMHQPLLDPLCLKRPPSGFAKQSHNEARTERSKAHLGPRGHIRVSRTQGSARATYRGLAAVANQDSFGVHILLIDRVKNIYVDVLAEVTAITDVTEYRVRNRRSVCANVALLRSEPGGLGGQEVASSDCKGPVRPNLVIDWYDTHGKRNQEKLGDKGTDQVAKGGAAKTQAEEILCGHRLYAAESANAVEIGDGSLGNRFLSVLGEGDISRQRHPVDLDGLGRSLSAVQCGRGRLRQLVRINAFGSTNLAVPPNGMASKSE